MFETKLYTKSKHVLCSTNRFLENRTDYEMRWKNILEPDMPQLKIWRMHYVC